MNIFDKNRQSKYKLDKSLLRSDSKKSNDFSLVSSIKWAFAKISEKFKKEDVENMPQNKDTSKEGTTLKSDVTQKNTSTPRVTDVMPEVMEKSGSLDSKEAKDTTGKVIKPKILEEDTKLTVILIENTWEVIKFKEKIEKIVESLVTTGYVAIVNYGSVVREGRIVNSKNFNFTYLLCQEDVGDMACLYDALIVLENLVSKNYKRVKEIGTRNIRINTIDIVGIGRAIDNCSVSSSEIGIESFCEIASKPNITTKYFCLNENNFVEAAAIGFHSIGAIARNYMQEE